MNTHLRRILEKYIGDLESAVISLDVEDSPIFIDEAEHQRFRYENETLEVACFLKAVRVMYGLNALISIMEAGFPFEAGVIIRSLDEAYNDIHFLLENYPNDLSSHQKKYLAAFFQEEFVDPADTTKGNNPRNRINNKKIHAAVAREVKEYSNPSDHQKMTQTISNAFSGYVHSAYPHIMEFYGGNPPSYNFKGLCGTPVIEVWELQLIQTFYHAGLAIAAIAGAYENVKVVNDLYSLRRWYEKNTGYNFEEN